MAKTEVKEVVFQKDQYGMTMYTSEYALSMIANTISNLEHGISRLAIDNNVSDETDLRGVEEKLEDLGSKVDRLTDAVDSIANELQSISSISETLDNFLGWYISFNENKKTK